MNANVALWFSALWPCVALAARRELAPALRGLLVAASVVLCGLAVLGQSRGWLFIAPVAALVFVALVPQRVRTVLTLALVLAATAAVTGTLLKVYRAADGRAFTDSVSSAATAIIVAALVAGVVGALAAVADRRVRPSAERSRRAGWALAAIAVVVAVGGLGVFVAAKGSPFTAAANAWHEFKTEPSPFGGQSRFTGSLGTHRYDFWRVAWDRFQARPLTGIGSDNFQEDYLAARRSDNAPKYPHSFQLRALSQTGLIGSALLALGVVAGLVAGVRAIRRRSGLGSVAAAAATASFAYWLLHGTIDWFWEFPALGAPAFALLGLAAGLLPRELRPPQRPARRRYPALVPAAVLVVALVMAISLGGPWLAELEEKKAVSTWRSDPAAAFDQLESAASLNPLSPTPRLFAGSIALRLGRPATAASYFRQAIDRDPRDAYAHLELGALLAQAGKRPEAIAILERARRLDPRDDLTLGVLQKVRRRQPVDIASVNRKLAARSVKAGQ
jgi:O-antigen ligase